jgi:hypothetical protein
MNPLMALRVKQCAVAHVIAFTIDPPDEFVAAPSRHPRDLVAVYRAESLLPEPETQKLLPPFRVRTPPLGQADAQSRFPIESRKG